MGVSMHNLVVYVKCDKCGKLQGYYGQYRCIGCGERLSNDSVAQQLLSERTTKCVCAWCKGVIRDGVEPVTHGICPRCLKEVEDDT